MNDAAGTLIVGAGLAGSALAMHLAEMGEPDVVVVDPDLAGERSSSRAQRRRRARDLVAARERGAVRRHDRLLRRAPRGARLPRARLPLAPRARALAPRPRRTCRCRTASAARWSCWRPPRSGAGGPSSTSSTASRAPPSPRRTGSSTRTRSASTTASRARAAGAVFLDRLLVTGVQARRRPRDRRGAARARRRRGGRGGPGGRRRRRAGAHASPAGGWSTPPAPGRRSWPT